MSIGKELQVIDPTTPGRDLTAYIASVNSIAVLTPEQERELANQYYYDDNVDAARQLVMAHLRFVVHMAKTYSGYGLPISTTATLIFSLAGGALGVSANLNILH